MPVNLSAQAILFAINSALRLGRSIQKAYANSLRSKTLTLPLPSFDDQPKTFNAFRFFESEGAQFVEEIEGLKYLHRKHKNDGLERGPEEDEYLEYYRSLFFMVRQGSTNEQIKASGLNTQDVVSLLKIRQWEKQPQFATTTLQLVAGTIVEIGIDYFNQFPGALHTESTMGKALSHLLRALDTISLSEEGDFKKAISQKILPRLFITAAETLKDLPEEVIRDEKLRQFIEVTSQGISEDLHDLIGPEMTLEESDEAIHWGQLLLSSLIRNAGHYVFSPSSELLDLNEGQEKLIKSTGLMMLDLLYAEDELKLDLKVLLHHEALDAILKNAFIIFAEYPELLAKDDRIRLIVKEVSLALAESGIPIVGIFPELLRLIFEKTALYLPLLWKVDEEEPRHLLVQALRETLEVLSDPENGPFELSSRQLLNILEYLFDEVIRNPNWITRKIEDKPLLHHLVRTSFNSLAKLPEEERLQFDTLIMLLDLNARLLSTHPQVLQKIAWEGTEEEIMLIEKVLDFSIACVFKNDDDEYSPVEKLEQLRNLLSYVLDFIISRHPDETGWQLVQILLDPEEGLDLSQNEVLLEEIGELFLNFIEHHLVLFSQNPALQNIIKEIIKVLKDHDWHQPDLLEDLLGLILERAAEQIDQVMIIEEDQPQYLLVVATRHILTELTQREEEGTWRPTLSSGQLIHLFHLLLEEVLERPEWITRQVDDTSLLTNLVEITFSSLHQLPVNERVSFDTLVTILEINSFAIAGNVKLLETIRWNTDEEEEVILKKAIDLVFDFIFKKSNTSLHRTRIALELLNYFLERILQKYPDHFGLRMIAFLLEEDARLHLSGGINEPLLDAYVTTLLSLITEHPEIVAPDPNLQKIIAGVAASLEDSEIDHPGLLPRVLQLILLETAEQIDLIYDEEEDSMKAILLEALRQILDALAFEPEEGQWKPTFDGDQIIELVLYLLEEVSEHVEWVDKDHRIYVTLNAIFEAFETIPRKRRPSFSLIKLTIIKIFEAVRNHPGYLDKLVINGEQEVVVLRLILDYLYQAIYSNIQLKLTQNILHQPSVMDALLDYYLYRTSFHPVEERTIKDAADKVAGAVKDLDEGRIENAEAFIDNVRDHLV